MSLITGGLGGLGLRAAALVAGMGASGLLLGSRSARVARDGQTLEKWLHSLLVSATTATHIIASDVSDCSEVYAVLQPLLRRTGQPLLTGVLHSAGCAGRPHLLNQQTSDDFWSAFASKGQAAGFLHAGTASISLSSCVFFSSVAALYDCRGTLRATTYHAARLPTDQSLHFQVWETTPQPTHPWIA